MQTDKTTTENKQPLYKVLNEQRTQGTIDVQVIAGMGLAGLDLYQLKDQNNKLIAKMYASSESEIKANAQYTALAVNNLHHLAEALDEIANAKIESVLDAALMKVKAQKALKLIS